MTLADYFQAAYLLAHRYGYDVRVTPPCAGGLTEVSLVAYASGRKLWTLTGDFGAPNTPDKVGENITLDGENGYRIPVKSVAEFTRGVVSPESAAVKPSSKSREEVSRWR